MENVTASTNTFPSVKRDLGSERRIEFRFEMVQGQLVIHPYIMYEAPNPFIRRTKLSGVPDTVSLKKLCKAQTFLKDAMVQVRECIDGAYVHCLPRARGGMESEEVDENKEPPSSPRKPGFNEHSVEQLLEQLKQKGITQENAAYEFIEFGEDHFKKGNFQEAIRCYETSLNISLFLKDLTGQGDAYSSLGKVLYEQRDYRNAIDLYEEALNTYRKRLCHDCLSVADALNNLGNAWRGIGNKFKAITFFEQALGIYKKLLGDKHISVEDTLGNLIHCCIECECYVRSIDFYEQVLEIQRGKYSDALPCMAKTISNLGNAYFKNENYYEAIKCYKDALKSQGENDNEQTDMPEIYNNIGAAHMMRKEWDKAEKYFYEAINLYSQRTLEHNDQELQIALFEEQCRSYRLLEEVLIVQGRYPEALSIADYGRSRNLVDILGNKISSEKKQEHKPLSLDEIQELAKTHQTTFLFFSNSYLNKSIFHAWVIPPEGKISYEALEATNFVPYELMGDCYKKLRSQAAAEVDIMGCSAFRVINGLEDLAFEKSPLDENFQSSHNKRVKEKMQQLEKDLRHTNNYNEMLKVLCDSILTYQDKWLWKKSIHSCITAEQVVEKLKDKVALQKRLDMKLVADRDPTIPLNQTAR